MISYHMSWQLNSSSPSEMYTSETLRHIGTQVEAIISQHNSLQMHKRAIERQLASIADQIHAHDEVLIPRNIFLLLEIRGSGGVSGQIEQIAHILHEEGYWKPRERVQNYSGQDVYQLGKSAQRLFDDYTVLDHRVEQLNARLESIKEHQHMAAEMTPQEVLEPLATTTVALQVQSEVGALVELLEPASRPSWLNCLFRWISPPLPLLTVTRTSSPSSTS